MADEQTIQPDTTTSTTPTDAPVADAPAQQPEQAVEAADGEAKVETDAEGSVLGGDVADDKPAADEAPAGAPEAYELALEGTTLDAEAVAEAEPVLRELNLSNEAANKLLPVAANLVAKTADRTVQQIIEAGATQRKEWLDAFKADPEIGGAKEAETVGLAARALDYFGHPVGSEFRKALTETGFGNHPEMIRMMRKVGEMVGEDGFVRTDAGAKSEQPTETRWYGKKEG